MLVVRPAVKIEGSLTPSCLRTGWSTAISEVVHLSLFPSSGCIRWGQNCICILLVRMFFIKYNCFSARPDVAEIYKNVAAGFLTRFHATLYATIRLLPW